MKKSVLSDLVRFCLPFVILFTFLFSFSQLTRIFSATAARLISATVSPAINFKRLFFSPINGIRLEEVRLRHEQGFDISAGVVSLKYSLRRLWPVRLAIKTITIHEGQMEKWGQIRPSSFHNIFSLDRKRFDQFPGGLEVFLNESVFCFENFQVDIPAAFAHKPFDEVTLDFCLQGRSQKLSGEGKVSCRLGEYKTFLTAQNSFPPQQRRDADRREEFSWGRGFLAPVSHFSFQLAAMGQDLLVDARLDYESYHLFGSGIISDFSAEPQTDIKFHSLPIPLNYYTWLKTVRTKEGQVSLLGHLTGPLNDLSLRLEFVIPATELVIDQDTLGLDHIHGLMSYRLKDQSLSIEQIKANIDAYFTVYLSGKVENIFSPVFDVRCQVQRLSNLAKRYDWVIEFKGQPQENRLIGEARLIWSGTQSRQYVCLLKALNIQRQDSPSRRNGFRMAAEGMELSHRISRDHQEVLLQKFLFDRVSLDLNFFGKHTFINNLVMHGYGGRVFAKGEFYFNQQQQEFAVSSHVHQLDLKNVKVFYPVFCELSGVISGQVSVRHLKGWRVKGILAAEEFQLTHFNPLDKIADFLGLNTIKEINNAQIVAGFDFSPQESTIEQFDFDSENLQMRSRFNITKARWLEGTVALSMPRIRLEESKIFKRLIAIAREREEKLDFLMRVSGFADSLRTELIESTLRDTLKERLSVRIQKYIEEKISQALESQGH